MANTFKNAALADVATGSYTDLYTTPSATQVVILGLALANKNSAAVTVDVQFYDSSATTGYQLLSTVTIPGFTTLETLAGQKYILEAGDKLKVKAGTSSSIDVVLGLMEKT
jgi:predicted cupin superfamily sugar epimerase